MRLRHLFVVLACTLAGCHESTSPELGSLLGEWYAAPSVNADGTTYVVTLSLGSDHSFVRNWQDFGPSSAQGSNRLAYVTTEGTFTVRGDSIFLRTTLQRSWDRDFNGGAVTVTPIASDINSASGMRFEIGETKLTLHYLSYPADAPIETAETFFRGLEI